MADTTLLLAGTETQCPPCFVCGQGVNEEMGGLWSLPGVGSNAAPGMIHATCAIVELARIRTPEYLEAHPKTNTTCRNLRLKG